MDRIAGLEGWLNGFARGGAWAAAAVLLVTAVELAPLLLG